MLRSATAADIISGWYVYGYGSHGESRRYVVNPYPFPTSTFTPDEASAYCEMLKADGIEPLYRASEPHVI